MNCPFSKVELREDSVVERICRCQHPDYPSHKLAEGLQRLGKTLVPNYECQYVRELTYEDCPLFKDSWHQDKRGEILF